MLLVCFRSLELRTAEPARKPSDVAVLQHVLLQSSPGVQPHLAHAAMVFGVIMRIHVLSEGAGSLVRFMAIGTAVSLDERVSLLVLLQRSSLKNDCIRFLLVAVRVLLPWRTFCGISRIRTPVSSYATI